MIVSGSNEQLGDLSFVARRSERAEHQNHLVLFDEVARQTNSGSRIGFVVLRDEAHLAAIDATALVEHLEIGRFRLADRPEDREAPAIRHEIANSDLVARYPSGARVRKLRPAMQEQQRWRVECGAGWSCQELGFIDSGPPSCCKRVQDSGKFRCPELESR